MEDGAVKPHPKGAGCWLGWDNPGFSDTLESESPRKEP